MNSFTSAAPGAKGAGTTRCTQTFRHARARQRCPDLGLFQVNVCGSYLTTKIYPVSGLPEEDEDRGDRDREPEAAIGNFYVAPGMGKPVAYDLPGGRVDDGFHGQQCSTCP